MNKPTDESANAVTMYGKGYRYYIHIKENGVDVPSLYVKTYRDLFKLLQETYPNGTIHRILAINAEGEFLSLGREHDQ